MWSLGHRNVQGLAWDGAGRMYATEFGQNTWDEVNLIVPGGNYGWPVVEGRSSDPRFRSPVVQWSPAEASPCSGMSFYRGSLYVAAPRGQRVWRLPLIDGPAVLGAPQAYATGELGRLRDVLVDLTADEPSLLVLTNNVGRAPRDGDDRVVRFPLG